MKLILCRGITLVYDIQKQLFIDSLIDGMSEAAQFSNISTCNHPAAIGDTRPHYLNLT